MAAVEAREGSDRVPDAPAASFPAPAASVAKMEASDGSAAAADEVKMEDTDGSAAAAEPAAASGPASVSAADEVKMQVTDGIAVAAEPASASGASEAEVTATAGEGFAAEGERAVVPSVGEILMDTDEGGSTGEEHSAAPAASKVNVQDNSISGEVKDFAPVASEEKMEVDGGAVPNQEHSAVLVGNEVNVQGVPGEAQDVAPVVSEAEMEVDDARISEEKCTAAPVDSEVKMEEANGRVLNQEAAAPGGAPPVKEEAGECLVGRYIGKTASRHGRILIGKVASYDSATEVSCRKRKLDLLVSSGSGSEVKAPPSTRQRVDSSEVSAKPDVSQQSGSGSDMSEDADTSSNSSDCTKETPSDPSPPVQIVELPPSSGDIAVPEEAISHLFSVYNFLRSFNVQLFLSPFGLDDFVAAINCTVQNNLLDAVHVSLLRTLKRHLETQSAEGSQLASNCLKYLDWTLLDALTWPAFLLEYLCLMGCIKDLGGQSFGRNLLAIEYYKLPVAMKLRVLQILCDHVIDSDELKTELEDREGYNEEMEYEMDSSLLSEAGSRAVSNRAAKASAYKRMNDLQNQESAPNVTDPEPVVSNAAQDGNSDDCRICGMDGTLVCCDGCPWAYHSRCIGLNKASLPQGQWFCPECVVDKLGPTSSRIERGARGAQMFGVDMCGRLFLGSCNYLLVIGTSSHTESYARYYNNYDVVKVLQLLAPSDVYTDICRRIVEYWKDLRDIFQRERSKIGQEVGASHTPQSNVLSFAPLKDNVDSKTVALTQTNAHHGSVANQFTVCSAEQMVEQKCMTVFGAATEKNNEVCRQAQPTQNSIHNAPVNGVFRPSSTSHHNGSVVSGVSNIAQIQPAQSLFRPVLSSISGAMSGSKPAKQSSFRPQAYMNLYTHGHIAASAAANLAIITSEEGKVSASQLASNPRKKMAADNALQLKAFSPAAAQFIWPSTEKKLMEVPRDRCGWCLACRSSAIGNKKACFLNMATANAAKGSARFLSAMRLIKNSDSHFASIVAYLANMEESLRGLLVGSLQDMQQKQRWHKQLQEASNCRTIIPLLLEGTDWFLASPISNLTSAYNAWIYAIPNGEMKLESNIRGVAFSASWSKLIDDWPVESAGVSTGASRPAAYQKRGAGGRRGRKRLLASESGAATDDDNSWTWWSRGHISKRSLQRGALLCSTLRKAARQGGKKRIAGISYHEGSNLPRRTRQFAWRACVGLSQNSSQLAFQVRYLDAHIRWKEFVPPDQIPSDGKSSDADFSALRNAVVCDRKIVDNKIRYALKFPNQKHLPVRVTKNILEAEDNQDGNSKLWFSENHVPLYMVREFEQKPGVSPLSIPGVSDANSFTNFYARRVKASISDVFSYLFHKGDVYPCTSCKKDVLYRDVVKCSSCQGNCHKECITRSVGSKGSNASSLICKLCLQKRSLMLTSYNTNASYIRPQQKINGQQPVTAPKITFKVGSSHSAEPPVKLTGQPIAKVQAPPFVKAEAQQIMNVKAQPAAKVESQPLITMGASPVTNVATPKVSSLQTEPKTKSKKSKPEKTKKPKKVQAITYFGLVWKKNKNDNDGSDFRANDVILKSKDGIGSSIRPSCCLCNKAYSPDSLYVRCERCRNWFHGDALQLEEERIGELVAYRCCRCRRRAIPQCPHSDDYTKPEPEISEQTVATSSQSTMLSSEGTFALADQDPLLASYGIVEPIGDVTVDADLSTNMASFAPGSNQKLSIRRAQVKNFEYLDQASRSADEYYIHNQPPGSANINFSHMNEYQLSEADSLDASELGWDFSQGTAYAAPPDFSANYQSNDTSCGSFVADEFEPQTFFSFTELLEADDAQLDNAFEMSTGLQSDGNCAGSFDQGVNFDDMVFAVEDGSSNMSFPTNVPSDEVVCRNCKNSQPPPDLNCAVCGLHMHRHCSPWDESAQPAESATWTCGACREWR
ncbi:hypothetical protein EJB05_29525, partial [Eragrostis curvula]